MVEWQDCRMMVGRQDGWMEGCQDVKGKKGRIKGWKDGRMVGWNAGRMAGWQDSRMVQDYTIAG